MRMSTHLHSSPVCPERQVAPVIVLARRFPLGLLSELTVVANSQEALSGPNSSCGGLRIFGIVASKCEFATSVRIVVNRPKACKSGLESRCSSPFQFKVREGQVGQESNLQPAVVETQSGVSGGVGQCRHVPLCPTLAVV